MQSRTISKVPRKLVKPGQAFEGYGIRERLFRLNVGEGGSKAEWRNHF